MNSGGETDLEILLASLRPRLDPEQYAICSLDSGARELAARLSPRALLRFEEAEGTTLILPATEAVAAGLEAQLRWARIVLSVHSSLEAVGLLARVAGCLAAADIPCNAVSAAFHDHLFVPVAEAQRVLGVLEQLAGR